MTKAEEREQLRKIERLIMETEDGSYIRMAFAGCVKLAEENIEYDFGNSYPDIVEYKVKEIVRQSETIINLEHDLDVSERKIEELENRISTLVHLCDSKDAQIADTKRLADEWEQNAHDAGEMYCELERECAEKCAENMRLKAEIYDLRKECGK